MLNLIRRLAGVAPLSCLIALLVVCFGTDRVRADDVPVVPNAGFEMPGTARDPIAGWQIGYGGGADAAITLDDAVHHSGAWSARLSNRSAQKASVYAILSSQWITVKPKTSYVARYWVRGDKVRGCYFGVAFQNSGERRQYLPTGDYDWRQIACAFNTPEDCHAVSLRIAGDDVTNSLWIDDISLEVAARQLIDLPEQRCKKTFAGVFPRTKGSLPHHLLVFDCASLPDDVRRTAAALQGLVNRRQPRLYLINANGPPGEDAVWLQYMQAKGYTGEPERIDSLDRLIQRFRREIAGTIIVDPELPGSVNAAFMLSGLQNALPVSPDLAAKLRLPIVMDLRGRWKRNVDAYRYVYDHYWNRMNHHLLAWEYPLGGYYGSRDYMVEFNVFTFWVSSYGDQEKGADPDAEEEFVNELLAQTPANIPVMGWPMAGDTKGITEYAAVRWLSEYGKFVPGTSFCSNLSVHTAIHPDDSLFRQPSSSTPPAASLDKNHVYIALNILDSGDALWYWQRYQRQIWASPDRGSLPIGWCMNPTLYDTLPLVMQWYYEHATPNDTFFAAVSGLGYMNTQVYATRFRPGDRERIWTEYVHLADVYRRKADMAGIELYNGGWSEKTPPDSRLIQRFTQGMQGNSSDKTESEKVASSTSALEKSTLGKSTPEEHKVDRKVDRKVDQKAPLSNGLGYILADLGRHDNIQPDNAITFVDGVPVFHTITRYQVWTATAEVSRQEMTASNAWLLQEILTHTPTVRPGFMSTMAISWYYSPTWLRDLQAKLPPEYKVVSLGDLARLYQESRKSILSH